VGVSGSAFVSATPEGEARLSAAEFDAPRAGEPRSETAPGSSARGERVRDERCESKLFLLRLLKSAKAERYGGWSGVVIKRRLKDESGRCHGRRRRRSTESSAEAELGRRGRGGDNVHEGRHGRLGGGGETWRGRGGGRVRRTRRRSRG
jgi:hypothetical protein